MAANFNFRITSNSFILNELRLTWWAISLLDNPIKAAVRCFDLDVFEFSILMVSKWTSRKSTCHEVQLLWLLIKYPFYGIKWFPDCAIKPTYPNNMYVYIWSLLKLYTNKPLSTYFSCFTYEAFFTLNKQYYKINDWNKYIFFISTGTRNYENSQAFPDAFFVFWRNAQNNLFYWYIWIKQQRWTGYFGTFRRN